MCCEHEVRKLLHIFGIRVSGFPFLTNQSRSIIMSNPISIKWLSTVDNLETIASKQTSSTTTGSLILNPNKQDPSGESIYEFDSVWRTVSLTSPDDNSAVTFVITGIGTTTDGTTQTSGPNSIISESITGLDPSTGHGTVFSSNIYKRILSITYSSTVGISNVSAGFGSSGMTDILFTNLNRLSWHASVQGQVFNRTAMKYSIYKTLITQEDYKGGLVNYLPSFPIGSLGQTSNQFYGVDNPVTGLYAYIDHHTGPSESLIFTALQVGV